MKIAALCLASLLLGAAAGAVPAAAGKDEEACDLLKRTEIADVLGEDVGEPEDLGIGDSSCFWELSGADGGGLVLSLFRGREARPEYDDAEALYPESDVTDVADLGRRAFFTPFGQIWVQENRRTTFFLSGVFDAGPAEELARLAFDRL